MLSVSLYKIGLTLVSPKSLCVGDYRRTPDAAPYTARRTASLHRTGSSSSGRDCRHSQYDDVWPAVAAAVVVVVASASAAAPEWKSTMGALRGAKTAVAGHMAVAAAAAAAACILASLVQCPRSWWTWTGWERRQRQVMQPLGNKQATLSPPFSVSHNCSCL